MAIAQPGSRLKAPVFLSPVAVSVARDITLVPPTHRGTTALMEPEPVFDQGSQNPSNSAQLHPPKLYTPSEFSQLHRDDISPLETIQAWVRNFLAKPHAHLGRSGPVCPFLPQALKSNTVWFTTIRAAHLDPGEIEAIVKSYRDIFLQLSPQQGDMALYKSIILAFPDVAEHQVAELIDGVQQKLKPFFVEEGLMIGEFHPWNETPGLHSDLFRPLQSPMPMIAIRFMTESDLPFLDRLTDAPEQRLRYLEAYLNRLGNNLDQRKLNHAYEAHMLAQTQVTQATDSQPTAQTSRCPFTRLMNRLKSIGRGNNPSRVATSTSR